MWQGAILIILIDFHMIFRWFQIPHDSKISKMIPKAAFYMPRPQVALALAQLSGKQQAQLRELKVELCAQGGHNVSIVEKQQVFSFFFMFLSGSLVLSFTIIIYSI